MRWALRWRWAYIRAYICIFKLSWPWVNTIEGGIQMEKGYGYGDRYGYGNWADAGGGYGDAYEYEGGDWS